MENQAETPIPAPQLQQANGLNQTVTSTDGAACSLEYFCEMCEYYPLLPVHGHYECPRCRYKTKCCEGAPQD